MKAYIPIYCILLVVFGAWLFGLYLLAGKIDFEVIGISIFGTTLSILLIASIIWRVKNGVNLCANLESDPEKVKQNMLFIMQFGHAEGIVGAFKEFNKIFRNILNGSYRTGKYFVHGTSMKLTIWQQCRIFMVCA